MTGVKSTKILTRKEAQEKYVELRFAEVERIKRELLAEAMVMSNKELERDLEEMNDEKHGPEGGFENYIIRG